MEAAGFTAGGFYAHFPSKSALLAEAPRLSLGSCRARLFAGLEDLDGVEWLSAVVGRYLSRSRRDDPATGWPLPALAGEVSREGALPPRALSDRILSASRRYAVPEPAGPADPTEGPGKPKRTRKPTRGVA